MQNCEKQNNQDKMVAKEILQDMFAMYVCFNVQCKLKNPYIQEIYGYIMVFFYSVFLHELYAANLIDKNSTTEKAKPLINEFRQRFLKRQAILGKSHLEGIREEMGIDFENFAYDILLTVDKDRKEKLYSINLGIRDLERIEKDKLEMFNALAGVPEYWIKKLISNSDFKVILDKVLKAIDIACESYANEMDKKMNPIKYPYASAVFFKNPEPQEQDKYLVLYYYSYFSWLNMLDEFVPSLKVERQAFDLNIPYSLMKLKAMFIVAFGEIVLKLDTPIMQRIKKELKTCFTDSEIYRLNRRLRNNIHYKEVDKLTNDELKRIDVFQRKYIQIVLSIFEGTIKYKIGKRYRFIKWIADHTDSRVLKMK